MWLEIAGSVGVGLVAVVFFVRKRMSKKFGMHDASDEMDVSGKVVLITGGNSGLGKECALEMAKRGANVVIASRDVERSNLTVDEIKSKYPSSDIKALQLDLGSLESIQNFPKEFLQKYDHINILVNNAGVYCPLKKKMKTKEGFEFNFGVNHLGHFLLTNLLIDALRRGTPSRIVVVASTLSEKGTINFEDLLLEKENPDTSKANAYGNSKLANILFAQELARRLEGSGITTYALCPGWVKTDLARYAGLQWWQYVLMFFPALLFMRSVHQGVQTILHCCLSNKVAHENGRLYRNCTFWDTKSDLSEERAKKLWEESEKLVGYKSPI